MAGIYISVPELREVVGDAAAMKLLAEYGGGNTYIPAKLPDEHPLVMLIGRAAAEALVKEYTRDNVGAQIELPRGSSGLFAQYRRQLAEAVAEGGSDKDVARRLGISSRTVRRQRQKLRQEPDDRQGDLF